MQNCNTTSQSQIPGSHNWFSDLLSPKYRPSLFATTICLFFLLFGEQSVTTLTPSISLFTYHFCHANFFHFILNMCALWSFRPAWSTLITSLIIASLIPLMGCWIFSLTGTILIPPSCGLSAALLAMIARAYSYYELSILKPLLLILLFIPINHLLAFIPGTVCFSVTLHATAFISGLIFWDFLHYKKK